MRIAFLLVATGLLLACVAPPRVDVPTCTSSAASRAPSYACTSTAAFDSYYVALTTRLGSDLRYRYPKQLPLRVEFDADSAIESICAGDAAGPPPLNARGRVGRSLSALREIEGAPDCLAHTSLDLAPEIASQNWEVRQTRNRSDSLASCTSLRNVLCTNAYDPVCAVYPDGGTRTYANACEACRDTFVKGYLGGTCHQQ